MLEAVLPLSPSVSSDAGLGHTAPFKVERKTCTNVFLFVFCLYCCCCLFCFLFVCLLAGSDQAFCFLNARPRYKLSGTRPAVGRFTERSHFPPHDATAVFKHHIFQVLQQKSDFKAGFHFYHIKNKADCKKKQTNKTQTTV